MRLESIMLKNFRQYRDEIIEFAYSDKKRNLTVIQGTNGAGKTNLLNAITWCLYAQEMHLGDKYKALPLMNTATIAEMQSGTVREVLVQICMRDEENKQIIITRTLSFVKTEKGRMQQTSDHYANSPDGSVFKIGRQIGREIKLDRYPEYTLSKIIPATIQEYFFFDGERLDDYFRESSGEKIRKAVFKMSQLDIMKRAIDHLGGLKSDLLRKYKGLNPEVDSIRVEIERCAEQSTEHEKQLDRQKVERRQAAEQKQEFVAKLRGSSVPRIMQLDEERDKIRSDLANVRERLDELEKEKFAYLVGRAPYILGYRAIMVTKKLLESRKEAGDLPPQYRKGFVEKLIRTGTCICGTDISEETEHRRKVVRLLEGCDAISDMSGELMEEYGRITGILGSLQGFRKTQTDYGRRIKELEANVVEKSKRLDQITDEIEQVDVEKIRFWEGKRQEYETIEDRLKENIGRMKYIVDQDRKKLDDLNRRLMRELEKEEKYAILRRTLDLCDETIREAEKTRDSIMEDVQMEIEEKTKKQFFRLMWKKRTYKDVTIDKEYNISVRDQSGMEAIGALSAGERQMLALSFMAALNIISGFDSFIVIDTPLARLSKSVKETLADNLSDFFEDKQVCLLVTDEEYSSQVRKKLLPSIGREYKIQFIEGPSGSKARVVNYE